MAMFEGEEIESMSDYMLVESVAAILKRACEYGQTVEYTKLPKGFFAKKKQKFSMTRYVQRLLHYMDCSRSVFVTALIYVERLAKKGDLYLVNYLNVHRLFATALLLAIKYNDDEHYGNSYYAEVFGMRGLDEVNYLEAQLLNLLNFNLYVSPDDYFHRKMRLTQTAERRVSTAFQARARIDVLVSAV